MLDILLILLLGPIGIIIVIYRHLHNRSKSLTPEQNPNWYLSIALSKEDAFSQFFLLLSLLSLGVTLTAFNRNLNDPLSWHTIILITSIIGFIITYYYKTIYTLIFCLLGILTWWQYQIYLWIEPNKITPFALLTGLSFVALIFFIVGLLHNTQLRYKRFSLIYQLLGIFIFTAMLFFLSIQTGLHVLDETTQGKSLLTSWQLTISILILFTTLLSTTIYTIFKKLINVPEVIIIITLLSLFSLILFLPEQAIFIKRSYTYYSSTSGNLSPTGIAWAIVFNIILFFELLGLLFSGYLRRETWLINLGSLFLVLFVIAKYFDWFFTFLDKSVFFISAGILLFAIGWFMEKARKLMFQNIQNSNPNQS